MRRISDCIRQALGLRSPSREWLGLEPFECRGTWMVLGIAIAVVIGVLFRLLA